MRARRLLVIAFCLVAVTSVATPASAYVDEVPEAELGYLPMLRPFCPDPEDPSTWTLPDPIPCYFCHGTAAPTVADAGDPAVTADAAGPHGGYLSTTNKCGACHSTHTAPAGALVMLPAATVKGTCETCHDGTGGSGVYGVVLARTGDVDWETTGSSHRIDQTNVVPGGDPSSGDADATRTFAGESGFLTCSDCHSPHGTNVVNAFAGDRARSSVDGVVANTVTSTRLLKIAPNAGTAATLEYGSDWCGSCHSGRLSGSGMPNNHPVESAVNPPAAGLQFYYDYVARVAGPRVTATEYGTLGHTNNGFVMPYPRTVGEGGQFGHAPICQQCHEDARHVGDNPAYPLQIDDTETFTVTQEDGLPGDNPGPGSSDNPRFQNFPHESPNPGLLVEAGGDLCLNCHDVSQL